MAGAAEGRRAGTTTAPPAASGGGRGGRGQRAGDDRDRDVAGGVEQRRRPGPSSRARRRRSARRPGRGRRSSHRAGGRSARSPSRRPAVMPSGTTETSDPADVDAGAVGHQPGQRAHPQPVPRGAVRAGVGQEPAGDSERQADQERARRRGGAAEAGASEHQRAPVAQVGRAPRPTGGCGRASARSWSDHLRRAAAVGRRCHADSARIGAVAATVDARHARSPTSSTFYKDVRARLLLQTYALTGDLHAARVRCATRWSWPGTTGARCPGSTSRRTTSAPRCGPRPAPQHRAAVAPAEGHRRRDPGHARRPRQAARPPSARCCC